MVRLYANEAAKRLAAVFRKKAADAAGLEKVAVEPDAGFRTGSSSALDNLFGK